MIARPRRSVLYMPGSNPRAIAKARSLPADAIILDLEDSVAPEAKDAAREQVAAAVREGGFGRREVVIRINGVGFALGPRGSGGGRRRRARRDPAAQDRRPGLDHAGGAGTARGGRARAHPPLGDDGDADGHPACRLDRRGRRRSGLAARSAGHGAQRSRQGNARALRPRPRLDDRLARAMRRRGARAWRRHSRRRLQRYRRSPGFRGRMRCRGATWASTARR